MPALFAYIGSKSVNMLLYKTSEDYSFHKFPYVHTEILKASSSKTDFYKCLFELICKDNELKPSEVSFYLAGHVSEDLTSISKEIKILGDEVSILSSVKTCNPILIGDTHLVINDTFLSFLPYTIDKSGFTADTEQSNLYANLTIYPQMRLTDVATQTFVDRNLVTMLNNLSLVFDKQLPLTFIGDRFIGISDTYESNYLLVLALIKDLGVYDIQFDAYFKTLLTTMVKMAGFSIVSSEQTDIKKSFTFVNVTGSVECLITSNVGTNQLIELQAEQIFTVPVQLNDTVHIVVKNHDIGVVEKELNGSDLGIVFDTRTTKQVLLSDTRRFNEGLKVFSRALASM